MLVLQNEIGVVKKVDVGFSITTFFFGALAVLFKGMVKEAGIWFLVSILAYVLSPSLFLYYLIMFGYNIYMAITINKKQIVSLLEKGYKPFNEANEEILIKEGILGNNK